MHFRRGLYRALSASPGPELDGIGSAIFNVFEDAEVMPNYAGGTANPLSMTASRIDDDAYRDTLSLIPSWSSGHRSDETSQIWKMSAC